MSISYNSIYERAWFIGIMSLIILIVSHFVLGENGRNLYISGAVIFIITLILTYIYLFSEGRRNIFLLLMILYICSHFPIFLAGGGGLFNIVSALLFLTLIISPSSNKGKSDRFVSIVLFLLIASNLIGYVLSELSLIYILNGFVAFVGILTIFYMARHLILTKNRIKSVIIISSVLAIINLLVTLNTFFNIIHIQSPFFTSWYEKSEYQSITNSGTFSTIEIFGEWSMLNSFLLLPFIFYKGLKSFLKKRDFFLIYTGYFASLLSALLSFSKSVFVLIIVGTFLLIVVLSLINKTKNYIILSKTIVFILIISALSPLFVKYFQLDFIFERIKENPEFISNLIHNPLTGVGTTREAVFEIGLERISQKAWIFGNGWSTPQGNYYSWFKSYQYLKYADFHNLYFALIPIVGYSGLLLIVILFFQTIYRLLKNIWKYRKASHPIVPFMVGLLFVLIFFLIDEYKVNATRNSFFSIALMWLGLAISINSNIGKSNMVSQN